MGGKDKVMRKNKYQTLTHVFTLLLFATVVLNAAHAQEDNLKLSDIDNIWANHLAWKAEQPSLNPRYRESIIREALRINPKAEKPIELLFSLFLAKDQPTLAEMVLEYAQSQAINCNALNREFTAYIMKNKTTGESVSSHEENSFDMRTLDEKLQLVRAYITQKNFILAEERLLKLIRKDPKNLHLLGVLGQIYIMTREALLGSMLYSYLYSHQPNDIETVNNYAFFLRVLYRYQDALDLLLAFDRTHPANEMIIDNIISLCGSLDQLEIATEYTDRWISEFPESERAWLAYARVQLYCGKLEKAKEAAEKCLLLAPDDAVTPMVYLIEIARRQKRFDEGRSRISELKKLLSEKDFEKLSGNYTFTEFYEIGGNE